MEIAGLKKPLADQFIPLYCACACLGLNKRRLHGLC